MIMLPEKLQSELVEKVKAVKENARLDWSVAGAMGGIKHYTNHVEIVEYGDGGRAHVKAPKRLSSVLYHLESVRKLVRFGLFEYGSSKKRIEKEIANNEYLDRQGAPIPQMICAGVPGVLATEFLPHESLKLELVKLEDTEKIIKKLTDSLVEFHEYGAHGEPVMDNCFVSDGKVYFADMERFRRDSCRISLAKDLGVFIDSIRHVTKIENREVEEIVFGRYNDRGVKREYLSMFG